MLRLRACPPRQHWEAWIQARQRASPINSEHWVGGRDSNVAPSAEATGTGRLPASKQSQPEGKQERDDPDQPLPSFLEVVAGGRRLRAHPVAPAQRAVTEHVSEAR